MRIETFLQSSAEKTGAGAAIVVGGRAHSYDRIRRAAERVALALGDRGVKRGDRVAVLMDNSFAAVVVTFGIFMAGGVVCVVDKGHDGKSLARVLDRREAVALATESKFATLAAEALATTNHVRVVVLSGGGRGGVGANCVSLEDIVDRIGSTRTALPGGVGEDAAIVLGDLHDGGEDAPITLTHAELIAAADAAEPSEGLTLRSIFSFAGLCHLVKAVRLGITVVLDVPGEGWRAHEVRLPGLAAGFLPVMTVG